MSQNHRQDFTLEPLDNERLASLCGPFDAHLRQIEGALGVEIANRGTIFHISGAKPAVQAASRLIHALYEEAAEVSLDSAQIALRLSQANVEAAAE